MEDDFVLPDNMFTDNPKFIDTSHEYDDDCGDACKIQDTLMQTIMLIKQHMTMNMSNGKKNEYYFQN